MDRFTMLYCDTASCRVNEFEHGDDGECPACGFPGLPIPDRSR